MILPYVAYNKDIAEDIVQRALLKAVLNKDKYEEQGSLVFWLFRIAKNLLMDQRRIENRVKIVSIDKYPNYDIKEHVEEDVIVDSNLYILKKLITKLTDDQKEIIKLYYFDNLSFKEIAEFKGEKINTVLGRMHNAKKMLKKLFNLYKLKK